MGLEWEPHSAAPAGVTRKAWEGRGSLTRMPRNAEAKWRKFRV